MNIPIDERPRSMARLAKVRRLLLIVGSYSRCMHLRNMMAKSAALGQGVLAKK